MDPYNLAICFGPTLVPVPEDKDQVQYQNQVNELIKNIILFNDEIFPTHELGGAMYEKYISREPDDTWVFKYIYMLYTLLTITDSAKQTLNCYMTKGHFMGLMA